MAIQHIIASTAQKVAPVGSVNPIRFRTPDPRFFFNKSRKLSNSSRERSPFVTALRTLSDSSTRCTLSS